MVLTVEEVRECLSEAQNARYLDHQIGWWIEWWNHKKKDVLKTINEQPINEKRVMDILSDSEYRPRIMSELNRRCLNVYHIPHQKRIVVYINSRNKPAEFNVSEATDSMLLFMYYVQHMLETLIYPGAKAELVVDMLGGPSPTMAELKAQIYMFSGIISRTFPKLYGQLILCCNWGLFFRKAVMALGHSAGLSALILTPKELRDRYTPEYVPTVLEGSLDLATLEPVGDQIERFFTEGGDHRTFPELETVISETRTSVSSEGISVPSVSSPGMPPMMGVEAPISPDPAVSAEGNNELPPPLPTSQVDPSQEDTEEVAPPPTQSEEAPKIEKCSDPEAEGTGQVEESSESA